MTEPIANLGVRVATHEDLDGITATITAAFATDRCGAGPFPTSAR